MQTDHHMDRMDTTEHQARFELVQTDADQPWHTRFIASNGEPIWTTENYASHQDAIHAIELITGSPVRDRLGLREVAVVYTLAPEGLLEVRLVDERDKTDAVTS